MASVATAQAELCRLRQDIARIEGRLAEAERMDMPAAVAKPASGEDGKGKGAATLLTTRERRGRIRLGVDPLDAVLGGGLPLATLHEVRASECRDGGAAAGFVAALLARLAGSGAGPSVLWISEAGLRRESGGLHAPGLAALGFDPARLVQVTARTREEALWAFEAALACRGLGSAVCEMRRVSLDLSATRRCVLRAREAGVTGFLIRLGSEAEPSAADLRFRLTPFPAGRIGVFAAGVGRMTWRLALEKNRGGGLVTFTVEWNAHERSFADRGERKRLAHPQHLPAAPRDRPAHPTAEIPLVGFRRAS